MANNFNYDYAFGAYNEIQAELSSTFSFTQVDELVILKVSNKTHHRVVADAAIFLSVYYGADHTIFLNTYVNNDHYVFEHVLTE